jgi:hypothetical protein
VASVRFGESSLGRTVLAISGECGSHEERGRHRDRFPQGCLLLGEDEGWTGRFGMSDAPPTRHELRRAFWNEGGSSCLPTQSSDFITFLCSSKTGGTELSSTCCGRIAAS